MAKDYSKMINDVSKEIADKLEDDTLYRAFVATPIDTGMWGDHIAAEFDSLLKDIFLEETKEVERLQEKRLNTAKEFAVNYIVFNDRGPALSFEANTNYILDTIVAYFLNKPRPIKSDYRKVDNV